MSITIEKLKPLFPEFSNALLQELAQIGRWRKFNENEIVVDYGEKLNEILIVIDGMVAVYKPEEDKSFLLYYIQSGQTCSLSQTCGFLQEKSPVFMETTEATEILFLPVEMVYSLVHKYPEWFKFIIMNFRKRFDLMIDLLDQVVFKSLDERLLNYLNREKQIQEKSQIIKTHEQIAQDLGSSRVVISRLLKQLENENKVILGRNSITLKD